MKTACIGTRYSGPSILRESGSGRYEEVMGTPDYWQSVLLGIQTERRTMDSIIVGVCAVVAIAGIALMIYGGNK